MTEEMKQIVEEVILEIRNRNGHVKMNTLGSWSHHYEKWGTIINILTAQGYVLSDGSFVTLTEKGNNFDSFENEDARKYLAMEKGILEMQKLKGDNLKLTNDLLDYEKEKKRKNIALAISIIVAATAILGLVLKWLDCK